jgi:hypothetical protein
MKTIVEEWKTVGDFPNYEISNLGRCRIKKSGVLKSAIKNWAGRKCSVNSTEKAYVLVYKLSNSGVARCYSVGKLVATHFIPNPNGYKCIRYKDGDVFNACYLNIEWTQTTLRPVYVRYKVEYSKQERLEKLRMHRDRIGRIIKYIEDDRTGELINDEILPVIRSVAIRRMPFNEAEEFISFATDCFADAFSRGKGIVNIEKAVNWRVAEFFKYKRKQLKTVRLCEGFGKHNTEEFY